MNLPVPAQTEGIIQEFITGELLATQGRADETVASDLSLFRTGILDSFGLFRLVLHLEERFDVTIGDEEVIPENFDSVAAIIQFLESKRDGLTAESTVPVQQA